MKYFAKHLFASLMIVALATSVAWARDKVKSESITFATDVMVNGTRVKAGDYRLKFYEQTNELEILKGSKVVAKTSAHLEPRAEKSRETKIRFMNDELVGITISGDQHDIVVGAMNSQSGSL